MTSNAKEHINQIRRDKYWLDENGHLREVNPLVADLQDSIMNLSEGLYSSDAHFIFELIQNAEDNTYYSEQPSLSLTLTKNDPTGTKNSNGALIFQNNEVGFSPENVNAICAVGKSTKSKSQGYIGEKGIGFKSVFRITSTPHILSNGYRFCLPEYDPETKLGFIVPVWIEKNIEGIDPKQTTIILPLDKPDFNYEKVEAMLRDIEPETVLFLSKLRELSVSTDSGDNIVIIKDDKKNPLIQVLVEGKRAEKSVSEIHEFLVYPKQFFVPQNVTHEKRSKVTDRVVTIAYPTNSNASSGKMFAYLPIRNAKSNLPFLINADFIVTSSRETVQEEVVWNKWLVECVAEMIGDALDELKKHGYLSVNFLEKMVKGMLNLGEKNFIFPVVNAINEAFRARELLPSDDGIYISAKNAKLAEVRWLRNLVRDEQFSQIGFPEKKKWISGEITDAKRDVWNYLQKEIAIELITVEKFVNKINASFFEKQADDWLIDFYKSIKDSKNLWKKRSSEYYDDAGTLLSKPFIRLETGEHVKPFNDKDVSAYLPSESIADMSLPIVKISIAKDKDARQFLRDLGLPNFDITEEVIRYVIPKYDLPLHVTLDEHNRDIEKIVQAYNTDSQEKKQRLIEKLQKTPFILTGNQETEGVYRKPSETYFYSEELENYFSGNTNIGFASSTYTAEILSMLKQLGVSESVRISKKKPYYNGGNIDIANFHGWHTRGLNGFDPEIKIDGLEHALRSPTTLKSVFIWNYIAIPNMSCIQGKIETSTRQDFSNTNIREERSHEFGRLLVEMMWLPDINGIMHRPNEITLADLPAEFTRNESLAHILLRKEALPEPKNNVHDEALNLITKGDLEKRERLEKFLSASDDEQEKMLKAIPREVPSEPVPTFKDGIKNLERPQNGFIAREGKGEKSPVSDVDRYQGNLNELVESGVDEHESTLRINRFSLAKHTPSNADARSFLYEEYQGHCQVTGVTFPKAAKNAEGMAENYFEACSLLSYGNADYLNDAGNMVCVNADTMAKFKHASLEFLDEVEDVIRTFKENDGNMESVSVKILLAGEECSITWSQRHFMRLVALYEKA